MSALFNLARMTTPTIGTGPVTLGAAPPGYFSFAGAGVVNGQWLTYVLLEGANCEVGYGQYNSTGPTLTRNPFLSTNNNALINLSGSASVYNAAAASDFPFPNNWLTGLALSNDGANPNTVLDIAAGCAADNTNTDVIRLTAAITKSTSAWAAGTGNGALDTGSIAASTWYHVHLIRRPDTGVADVLFSTSLTAPVLPTNYSQSRRIGSFVTDASSRIVAFSQNGDEFLYATPVNNINTTTLGTTATLYTLSVPIGLKINALIRGYIDNASTGKNVLINSPDVVAAVPNTPPGNTTAQSSAKPVAFVGNVRTNTAGQIRAVADSANTTLVVTIFGWVDTRGKV